MSQPTVSLEEAARYTEVTALPESFDPPERITALILSDLCAHNTSLGDIAAKANTTFDALSRWLERPDIQARLDAMESVMARRCRLQLANNSGGIMTACNSIITNYNLSESHILVKDGDWRGHAIIARKASNALTASRVLLELFRHFSAPPRKPREDTNDHASLPRPNPNPNHNLFGSGSNPNPRFTLLPNLPSLLHENSAACRAPAVTPGQCATHAADPFPATTNRPEEPTRPEAQSPCPEPPASITGPSARSDHPPISDLMRESSPAVRAEDPERPAEPIASHAEGMTANSRRWSESASETLGTPRAQPPHPEGVHAAPAHNPHPIPPAFPQRTGACNCAHGNSCNRCRETLRNPEHRTRDPTPARS